MYKPFLFSKGENVVLKAQFMGTSPITYSWLKDDSELLGSDRVKLSTDGSWSILEILNANIDDEAEYVCIATNDHGECESAAELLVDGE